MKLPKVGRLLLTALLVAGAAASLTACNKPSESSCRQALANMQRLMGTENVRDPEQLEGEVRRCKGGSKKAAVACAIKAQTFDELKHCNFYHLPDNLLPSNLRDSAGSGTTGTGSAAMTGSATGSAAMTGSATGSADTGSATTGSAATGSAGSAAMGSAAAGSAAMGSGAGSAAKGSTAKGSAAGSAATGSAAK